jgi:hypothetical protein
MTGLPYLDLFHAGLSEIGTALFAQSPVLPSPSPTPSADLELLKSQLEFLKDANSRLNTSFTQFLEAMKYLLLVLGILGAFVTWTFNKSLEDAKRIAEQVIRQRVEGQVEEQVRLVVNTELENIKRLLGRERVVGSVTVDYYLPSMRTVPPEEFKLLEGRGFQQVRFWNQAYSDRLVADVVVLDLTSPEIWTASVSEEERQQRFAAAIDRTRERLGQTSILVVYVRPGSQRVQAIDRLGQQIKFYASANTPVTLVGVVTDAAAVAYGWREMG